MTITGNLSTDGSDDTTHVRGSDVDNLVLSEDSENYTINCSTMGGKFRIQNTNITNSSIINNTTGCIDVVHDVEHANPEMCDVDNLHLIIRPSCVVCIYEDKHLDKLLTLSISIDDYLPTIEAIDDIYHLLKKHGADEESALTLKNKMVETTAEGYGDEELTFYEYSACESIDNLDGLSFEVVLLPGNILQVTMLNEVH